MEFSIGDKVSFLNEIGGGVVVAIKDKQTVMVSDDDGFTTPYHIRKLVKVNVVSVSPVEQTSIQHAIESQPLIALVFVPLDLKNPNSSALGIYLINNSGDDFYFELYHVFDDQVFLFSQSQVSDRSIHFIKEIQKSELESFCNLRFQCLFNSSRRMKPRVPFEKHIQIKASKLYKESSFEYSTLIQKLAFSCILASTEEINRTQVISVTDAGYDMLKDSPENIRVSKPHHYLRKEEEIDLHIPEILENQMGLRSSQLLEIQIHLFKSELEKAIQLNYASITFIHGIGKGVLKEAIIKELQQYSGIKHYPASFKKYGHGAIKIEII